MVRIGTGMVLLFAATTAVGLLYMGLLDGGAIGDADDVGHLRGGNGLEVVPAHLAGSN